MIYRYISFGSYGQWFAAVVVAATSFVSGTFLGWPASALPQIKDGSAGFTLTYDEQSWMVASASVGAFCSPLIGQYLLDKIGRKHTLLLVAGLMLISWTTLYFATTAVPIIVARIFCGLFGGIEYTSVTLFIGEISEPHLRGTLGTIGELMLTSGAFFQSSIAYLPYRTIIICSAAPAIVLFISLLLIPESPYYLLMKKNREEATLAVRWLRGHCRPEEMDVIEDALKEQLNNKGSFSELFTSPVNLKALLIVQLLSVVVGSSSLILLMAYSSVILPDSFVSAQNGFTVLCLVWMASGAIACAIMDKIDRRTFLYISCVGTLLPISCTAIWYYMRDNTSYDTSTSTWVPLVMLAIAGLFEVGGIFNVPNVVKGEMFAMNIKSKGSALCCMLCNLCEGITTYFFYPITNNVGLYFNFVKIAITTTLCILIVKFAVIETRGKSLEEIQLKLNNDAKKRG